MNSYQQPPRNQPPSSPRGRLPTRLKARLDKIRQRKFKRPTLRQIGRGILFSPYYLLRFVVMLPVHIVRFIIKLPRRIWWLWTQGALGIVAFEKWLGRRRDDTKEGARLIRVHAPPNQALKALYVRFQPRRVKHIFGVWQMRLMRRRWDKNPHLLVVRKAIRWGRQYKRHTARFKGIDALRSHLITDETILDDLPLHPARGTVAQQISISKRRGGLLHGLTRFGKTQRALELGTGYGVSTLYLAEGLLENYPMRTCMLVSLEENGDRVQKTRNNLRRLVQDDFAEVRQGDIKDTLRRALDDINPIDLAFIDYTQDKDTLLSTFTKVKRHTHPSGIIVITNIHANRQMNQAWRAIKGMRQVAATVDLWWWGIVIIGPGPAVHIHTTF